MEWIQQALGSGQVGAAALAGAAVLGMLVAVGSCCNLPVVLAVAAYGGCRGDGDRGGLRSAGAGFFLGTLAAVLGFGALIVLADRTLNSLQGDGGRIAAGFIFLLFGLWVLDWLPFRLPGMAAPATPRLRSVPGAALFGFASGGATVLCSLSCSAALLPILAGLTAVPGGGWRAMAVLLMVALGYALALTALLLGVSFGRAAAFMKKTEKGIRLVSGLALLAAGLWLLAKG